MPLFLLPIYKAAAVQYGVPWQILAAINEIETNYGDGPVGVERRRRRLDAVHARTWLMYGVDALNAGYADPYNPVDAIFAAAAICARRARRPTCAGRSSPTTTPKNTSTR